jgi:hypothetical protein
METCGLKDRQGDNVTYGHGDIEIWTWRHRDMDKETLCRYCSN